MSERVISQERVRPDIPVETVCQLGSAAAVESVLTASPETPETPQPVPEAGSPGIIDRREFLFRIRNRAAGVGAAALLAEYGTMASLISDLGNQIGHDEDEIWPENRPTLTFLDGATYEGQEEITIYLPGFGDMHSVHEAKTWKDTSGIPEDRLVAAIDYSNEGTDIEGIAKVIRSSIDSRVKVINFVCRSIGGLYVLPLAAELGIPVGSILFMSSPSKLSNGDFGNLGQIASHLPANRPIATIFKFIYNFCLSVRDHDFDPARNIAEGWEKTLSGANPAALQKELKTATKVNIFDKSLLHKLRKVFRPNTKAAYTATNDPRSDETVMVVASGRDFEKVFRLLGIKLELLGMPYDGHANVEVTGHHMQRWAQSTPSPEVILAVK